MAETKNLYQRLLAITEEVGKIEKTGHNASQGYAFIEQSQVVAEVRAQLKKHGVMIIPETISRDVDRYVTIKPGYKPTDPPKESANFHVLVTSRYTLINVDTPEDRMVCEWDAGEALDTSDKATNKAVTASNKSFLMKLFNISDKDDPDAETPEAPATEATTPQTTPVSAHIDRMQAIQLMAAARGAGAKDKEAADTMLQVMTGMEKWTDLPRERYDRILAELNGLIPVNEVAGDQS